MKKKKNENQRNNKKTTKKGFKWIGIGIGAPPLAGHLCVCGCEKKMVGWGVFGLSSRITANVLLRVPPIYLLFLYLGSQMLLLPHAFQLPSRAISFAPTPKCRTSPVVVCRLSLVVLSLVVASFGLASLLFAHTQSALRLRFLHPPTPTAWIGLHIHMYALLFLFDIFFVLFFLLLPSFVWGHTQHLCRQRCRRRRRQFVFCDSFFCVCVYASVCVCVWVRECVSVCVCSLILSSSVIGRKANEWEADGAVRRGGLLLERERVGKRGRGGGRL